MAAQLKCLSALAVTCGALQLIVPVLILLALPNSIGALRFKYDLSSASVPKFTPQHNETPSGFGRAPKSSGQEIRGDFRHATAGGSGSGGGSGDGDQDVETSAGTDAFVRTDGHQFSLGGKTLYVNGANVYWLMSQASEDASRSTVKEVLSEAAEAGVTVVRTWAFADGVDYHALQLTPGVFDESVFQGLDFVVSEAKQQGIRLILSLVNNYGDYGGKPQYVAWANQYAGADLVSEDDFFSDATIRGWFKDYIKTVVTRVNTITEVAYRDEPAIFAWELMNEPRCSSDTTGNTFQAWAEEMAAYVKSVDPNHLLESGLEGFYSSTVFPASLVHEDSNPGTYFTQYGVDFIRNHDIPEIDFASVHSYPDNWMPSLTEPEKQEFMGTWLRTHIDDGAQRLQKPVLFAEFGKSSRTDGYNQSVRVSAMTAMFDAIYESAREGGAGAGALVWQILTTSTRTAFADGFEIVLSEDNEISSLMHMQASRLASIS